jgi:hypothetical protein
VTDGNDPADAKSDAESKKKPGVFAIRQIAGLIRRVCRPKEGIATFISKKSPLKRG